MAKIYGNRWLVKRSLNEGGQALSLSSRIGPASFRASTR